MTTGDKLRIFGVNHWFWANDGRTVVWPAATPETYTPDLWASIQKIVFPGATIEITASPLASKLHQKLALQELVILTNTILVQKLLMLLTLVLSEMKN